MKSVSLLLSCCLISICTFAQMGGTDQESKEAMGKLAFIEGEWKGEGWMMGQDGQKNPFSQTEDISFKLDGTALLIEGKGTDGDRTIHDALAIVTYNKKDKNYSFQSYLANGMAGKFKAELIDDKFYWYPMGNMRYIIFLNEEGQWKEIGEMKQGENWFQFFEMTLDKQ